MQTCNKCLAVSLYVSMVYRRVCETKHLYRDSDTCHGDRSTVQRDIRLCHRDRLSPRPETNRNFTLAVLYFAEPGRFALHFAPTGRLASFDIWPPKFKGVGVLMPKFMYIYILNYTLLAGPRSAVCRAPDS